MARRAARGPGLLLVSELFPPAIGGSAVLLSEVYRRVSSHPVTVLTDSRASPGPADSDLDPFEVHRRPIGTRRWGFSSPAGTWHHLRVASAVRRYSRGPDAVVHCGRALPEGIAAWVNHALGGAPYICWGHGEDISVAQTSRELTFVMRQVCRSASAIIANSRNTRAMVMGLGVPADRVHVVYPGVDPQRFHPDVDARELRASLLRDGDTLLLSVGRLQRRKGHDLVIEAVAALKDTCPGLRYIVAGDGDERARLEAMAAELRIAERVTFAGAIADADVPRYFAAADVFVMPNRRDGADTEGFGIVFLEAAASARPSIGGRDGGVPEAVDEGRTGLLVGGTDVQELAGSIQALVRDPARREALGRAGRERVMREFTWEHAAASVITIHERVAARGGLGPEC